MRLFCPQEEEKTKKEVLGLMRQTTLTGEVAPQDPRGRGIPQGCGHFVNSPHSQKIDVLGSGWNVLVFSGEAFFGNMFFDVRSY